MANETEQKPPPLPNYGQPHGVQVAPPGYHKPLFKMIKMMMKPKASRSTVHVGRKVGGRKKKGIKFY